MSEGSKMVLLTGLWKSQNRNGETMLSGNISKSARFVVLPNKAKNSKNESDSKKPDYLIFMAANEPKPEGSGPGI